VRVDTAAVEDLLCRVGRLAEDLPEVAELDLILVLASLTASWPWTSNSGSPRSVPNPMRRCGY